MQASGTSTERAIERRHVADVAESTGLFSVAEHRQRLALENVVHVDADHVAVAVADVLPLAVNVVRPKDDRVQAEKFVRGAEILLDGELRDAVGVLGKGAVSSVIGNWFLPYTAIDEVNTKALIS